MECPTPWYESAARSLKTLGSSAEAKGATASASAHCSRLCCTKRASEPSRSVASQIGDRPVAALITLGDL